MQEVRKANYDDLAVDVFRFLIPKPVRMRR
jgi:hypothetical protein